MSINVHFDDGDWERLERNWSAWWAGELERPLVVIYGLEPPSGFAEEMPHPFASSYPLEMPAVEVVARYEVELAAKRFYGDAWPTWRPNLGPGDVAAFLGARAHAVPDTVWFTPADEAPIGELQPAYDPDNAWWRRALDLTRVAVERWGDRVCVGHTDLGCNLDLLASLRGTQPLLLDLVDAPGEVERLVGELTRLALRYFEELSAIIEPAGRGTTCWAPIWSPARTHMLQCDCSYMISPAMFERFVLPDLVAWCEALEHAFYHLDGVGALPHLDGLLSLEGLRGIQWVPGAGRPGPEEWLDVLGRIRDAGKLCQEHVSPEGALTIVRELGGRGFAFLITQAMSQQEAGAFLSAVGAAG